MQTMAYPAGAGVPVSFRVRAMFR